MGARRLHARANPLRWTRTATGYFAFANWAIEKQPQLRGWALYYRRHDTDDWRQLGTYSTLNAAKLAAERSGLPTSRKNPHRAERHRKWLARSGTTPWPKPRTQLAKRAKSLSTRAERLLDEQRRMVEDGRFDIDHLADKHTRKWIKLEKDFKAFHKLLLKKRKYAAADHVERAHYWIDAHLPENSHMPLWSAQKELDEPGSTSPPKPLRTAPPSHWEPRANPKRTRAGRKSKPDVGKEGRYKRFRVRDPKRFQQMRTITLGWQKSSNDADLAWARKQARAKYSGFPTRLPKGTKIVTGKFNANARGDRPKGKKGGYLAWGVVAILVPLPAWDCTPPKRKNPTRRKTARKKPPRATRKRPTHAIKARVAEARAGRRRANPGRLMVLNPLPPAIDRWAKHQRLNAAERRELNAAVAKYTEFHGEPPTEIIEVGSNPNSKNREILVGMGRAPDVSYDTNGKRFKKSNKKGTPWRHEWEEMPHIATTADGTEIRLLGPSVQVADWVHG